MWFAIIYVAVPWGSLTSILTSSTEEGSGTDGLTVYLILVMKLQKVARR
jgi:hypothetical protein